MSKIIYSFGVHIGIKGMCYCICEYQLYVLCDSQVIFVIFLIPIYENLIKCPYQNRLDYRFNY